MSECVVLCGGGGGGGKLNTIKQILLIGLLYYIKAEGRTE